MQTATAPQTKGKTNLQDAIDQAKAKGQAVKPEALNAAKAVEKVTVKVKEPVMPETPKNVRTVVDEPESKELDTVQPAEIQNGQLILTPKHLDLIKTQIAKDATKQELDLFLMMAYRTRLDPLMRQLYFIKYGNNVSYVTSIDGYRIVAHRTNEFAGVNEPVYSYDKNEKLTHCSISVYKFVGGIKCAFTAKVKFSEYNTGKNMWSKIPETMIAKVAEAHALRKAFPQDLSGIYTTDEMDQAKRESEPQKKKVERISRSQARVITQLIEEKELEVDRVKAFVKKAYKCTSVGQMTKEQATHLIKRLEKMPTPEPVVDLEPEEEMPDDDEFASFVDSENQEKWNSDDIANDAVEALS